jgi:NADPH:quinone reductase-like Zn-dependent oxidoreductase
VRDVGKLSAGQKVAVNGASGGVGTYALQFAKWLGGEVTAICSTAKVDLTKALGADHVIDYTKEDFTKNGTRYDLILGVNGYQRLKDYRRALTSNGTYVFAGGTNKQIFEGMLRVPLMNLRSSESLLAVGEKPNAADLQLVAELVESGTVRPVIDRRYPFQEAPQAVAYVQKGHAAGKVIVEVRPETP